MMFSPMEQLLKYIRQRCIFAISIFAFALPLSYSPLLAQSPMQDDLNKITITSGFLEDSMVVGDQVRYYLTALYPQHLDILFPDSTYAFEPFEYHHKTYIPTRTRDSVSYDSVVYFLQSFEVDLVQTLQLPIYQLHKKDTITHLSLVDTIRLSELVTIPLDTIPTEALPLKWNVAYEHVKKLFNYPIAFIIGLALTLLGVVLWMLFWKPVKRYFKLRSLNKRFEKFQQQFNTEVQNIQTNRPSTIETPLNTWKNFLENLENNPYTKLTSKEWFELDKDETLYQQLRRIDQAIYGSVGADSTTEAFNNLKNIAEERYRKKAQHIKHG
jgi:hypothetical protein